MTRSFSSLSITNALCLTSVWILVALGLYVTKMQNDQEKQDIYDFISKTNLTHVKNDTEINLPSYFLPAQSLKTISKSLIWLGFVLDTAVCFTEFMVVWLTLQAPPAYFYLYSAWRYVLYFWHVFSWYIVEANNLAWSNLELHLGLWLTYRIIVAIAMCCVNYKLSKKIHRINNPVVYAVGPIGNKAMSGA